LARLAKITQKNVLVTILLDLALENCYNVYMKRTHGQTPAARAATQAKYNSKPAQVERRTDRNAARAKMVAAGKASKGDGKDVAHKDNNTSNNTMKNLLLQPPKVNRSFKRNSKGGHK
jgi:hypothetical protein